MLVVMVSAYLYHVYSEEVKREIMNYVGRILNIDKNPPKTKMYLRGIEFVLWRVFVVSTVMCTDVKTCQLASDSPVHGLEGCDLPKE